MDDDSTLDASLPEATIGWGARQLALHRALGERHQNLAVYYEGALGVPGHSINPDHLSHAAHGIRELMVKLPIYADVDMQAHQESLKGKVNQLHDAWEYARRSSGCLIDDSWGGAIDAPVLKLLRSIDTFYEWFDTHHPRRKEELAQLLTALDPSGRLLKHLQESNIRDWWDMRDYFVGLAHHRFPSTVDEFTSWLSRLERFLLPRLVPATFDDFAEIDKIIEEANAGS